MAVAGGWLVFLKSPLPFLGRSLSECVFESNCNMRAGQFSCNPASFFYNATVKNRTKKVENT